MIRVLKRIVEMRSVLEVDSLQTFPVATLRRIDT